MGQADVIPPPGEVPEGVTTTGTSGGMEGVTEKVDQSWSRGSGHSQRGWPMRGKCNRKERAMSKSARRLRKGCTAKKRVLYGWKKT